MGNDFPRLLRARRTGRSGSRAPPPDEFALFVCSLDSARTIFRLLPEFRTCIREINFMLSLMAKEIVALSKCRE